MMFRRIIHWFLILSILAGGFLAWQSGQTRARLQAEFQQLKQITGDLTITDPAKVHVQALPSDDKLSFAWRIYLPPHYHPRLTSSSGGQHTSSRSEAIDFIARVRFRENDQGQIEVYTKFSNGSSTSSLGDAQLTSFLRDRWGELKVTQLGESGLVTIEPDQVASLLKLTMPDAMVAEARAGGLPTWLQGRVVPELFELRLDSRP